MKFKIISMLVTLGMLSVVPLIYMGKIDPMGMLGMDGSGEGLDRAGRITQLKGQAPKNLTNVTTDQKVQLYKWRDEHGVMQFSQTPPRGVQAKQVNLNPNENIVKAVKIPPREEKQVAENNTVETPNPYSVKGIKKVMQDAKNVEKLLQQRHEEQQKMMGDL